MNELEQLVGFDIDSAIGELDKVQGLVMTENSDVIDIQMEPVTEDTHANVAEELAANSEVIHGKEVASIKSHYYGAFIKLLETVSAGTGPEDIVNIEKGKLIISKSGGTVSCDLTNLFEENSWSLKNPLHNIKLLKSINTNDKPVKNGPERKVTILEDGAEYIIYSSENKEITSSTSIARPASTTTLPQLVTDPGEAISKVELSISRATSLSIARNAWGAYYYNITIDKNTNEILMIDVQDKHKEVLKSVTGRETFKFKVQELFTVSKPDYIILELYKKANLDANKQPVLDNVTKEPTFSYYIKSSSDLKMTVVELLIKGTAYVPVSDLSAMY